MINLKVLLLLCFSIALLPYQAKSAEGQSAQEIMAVSKITGACGILNSMVHFQQTTKMSGGDEFISRFWLTEATRRGMTMKQLTEQCNKAISMYESLWKALESSK